MKKLCFLSLFVSVSAFAFGGGGGTASPSARYKGLDSVGVHFGGSGNADVTFGCASCAEPDKTQHGICVAKNKNEVYNPLTGTCAPNPCLGTLPECTSACTLQFTTEGVTASYTLADKGTYCTTIDNTAGQCNNEMCEECSSITGCTTYGDNCSCEKCSEGYGSQCRLCQATQGNADDLGCATGSVCVADTTGYGDSCAQGCRNTGSDLTRDKGCTNEKPICGSSLIADNQISSTCYKCQDSATYNGVDLGCSADKPFCASVDDLNGDKSMGAACHSCDEDGREWSYTLNKCVCPINTMWNGTECVACVSPTPYAPQNSTKCFACQNTATDDSVDTGCSAQNPFCGVTEANGYGDTCYLCQNTAEGGVETDSEKKQGVANMDSGCSQSAPICIQNDEKPDGNPFENTKTKPFGQRCISCPELGQEVADNLGITLTEETNWVWNTALNACYSPNTIMRNVVQKSVSVPADETGEKRLEAVSLGPYTSNYIISLGKEGEPGGADDAMELDIIEKNGTTKRIFDPVKTYPSRFYGDFYYLRAGQKAVIYARDDYGTSCSFKAIVELRLGKEEDMKPFYRRSNQYCTSYSGHVCYGNYAADTYEVVPFGR